MTGVSGRYLKRVRIFIASPRDLAAERRKFPKIIENVNKIKAKPRGVLLEPVGWEDTLPGMGRPQEKINEDIKRSDLILMLLWTRWGTPTGKWSSGFEEEYEVACSNNKEIWLYFRLIPDKILAYPDEQLRKVLAFRKKVETERKLLFRTYTREGQWQERFTEDLCRWLDRLPAGTFELERPMEYPRRIEQLVSELEESISKQFDAANMLAKEAREQADSGHITKAEELFAKALAIHLGPAILNDYGLFLTRIGALKKAEETFIQLIRVSHELHDEVRLAMAYGNIGLVYRARGDLKAAEDMFKKALAIDEKFGVKEGIASAYCNLANIRTRLGDLVTAEEMYKKALAIDEKLGRREGMLNVYGSLGNVYSTRGDLNAAAEMYRKALDISEETGQKEGLAISYCNLGITRARLGDLAVAEEMFKKALAIDEKLGRKVGLSSDYGNLGNIHMMRGDLGAAEEMYKKALTIEEELGRREEMATVYTSLGRLYMILDDLEAAEESYKKALAIFVSNGSRAMIREIKARIEEVRRSRKEH